MRFLTAWILVLAATSVGAAESPGLASWFPRLRVGMWVEVDGALLGPGVFEAKEIKKLGPTADDPYSVAWSEKAKHLAVCGYSGQVTVWALDADKPKFTHAIKNPGYCVAFTPDGKGVYTGHNNGTVAVTPIGAK